MDETRGTGPVTRDKLIEAAGEIFAEKGLHGARIRDITDRAGANIAAVNYHFHDKFELYTVVLERAHETVFMASAMALTADTPEGRIRQLLAALITSALDPNRPKWHTMLLGRELMKPTPALDRLDEALRETSARLRKAVEEIRPDLSQEDARLAACSIVAQCIFHVHHRHLIHRLFPELGEPPVDKLAGYLIEFSLAALRGFPRGEICSG